MTTQVQIFFLTKEKLASLSALEKNMKALMPLLGAFGSFFFFGLFFDPSSSPSFAFLLDDDGLVAVASFFGFFCCQRKFQLHKEF
jgi:hypothetical protein